MNFRVWAVGLGMIGGLLQSSHAQAYMPRVTSASLGGAATLAPGGNLTITFSLAPEAAASVVTFIFANGDYSRAVSTSSPLTGSASIAVDSDWPNGTYRLSSIEVANTTGAYIQYGADGTVISNDAPWLAAAPGSTPNAAALDFTIAGGIVTVIPPELLSFTRTSANPLSAGSPITFDFTTKPGSSSTWKVNLRLTDPAGRSILTDTLLNAATGTFTVPTAADWTSGGYRVSRVLVYDANSVAIYSRGTALVPATTDFNLSSGVTPVPPQLTAVERSSVGTVTVGDAVILTFNVVPGSSAVATVAFNFTGPDAMARSAVATNIASQTATTTVDASWLNGTFALSTVVVTDSLNRTITYNRGGTYRTGDGLNSGSHTLNLAALDFQVAGALTIPPSITSQPQGGTVQPGQTLTLRVQTASGSIPRFQWYVGQPGATGTPIESATGSEYTPPAAASTTTYWVRVTSASGGSTDSATATIAINYPSLGPSIITQPVGVDHLVNNGALLDPFVVGPAPLSYQWLKDGAEIPGAISRQLALFPGLLSDSGTYVLRVTNPNGSATTAPAIVVFEDTPTIVLQPAPQSVVMGGTAVFSVTASGGNLRYEWNLNNSLPIAGAIADGNTLTIPNVQRSQGGAYQARIINNAGSVFSATAMLTVTGGPPPVVTLGPVILGQVGQSFGYSPQTDGYTTGFSATGLPPGLVIDSQSGLISGTPTTAGTFPVALMVTNSGGSTTANASFTITTSQVAPVFVRQPQSQTAVLHTQITFTAGATGSGSLTFQWNFNGQPLPGQFGESLVVGVDSTAKAGDYTVDATGSGGLTRSNAAHLTVDSTKSAPFVTATSANQTVTAGSTANLSFVCDGTPPLTIQWYRYLQPIAGAMSSTYASDNASAADNAQYFATITNAYGTASTFTRTILVNYVPSPVAQSILTGSSTTIAVPSSSQIVSYQWYRGTSGNMGQPIADGTGPTLTTPSLSQTTSFWVMVQSADKVALSSTATVEVTATVVPPTVPVAPENQSATPGASAQLSVVPSGTGPFTYRWMKDGAVVGGASTSILTLGGVGLQDVGVYSVIVTNAAGSRPSAPAILGLSTTDKVLGAGSVVGSDILHPTGNVYDQVLLGGSAAAITADPGQVTRLSFIDLNNDIVQVEFSGPGTLALTLDGASAPARPLNYNQAVDYPKGHAAIVVTGADESTNLSVFTVGRATAFDRSGAFNFLAPTSAANDPAFNGSPLFDGHATTSYDGIADIAYIAIQSTDGKFGGLRAGDARLFATNGITGIYAPGVQFVGPVYVGDVQAFDLATPVIVLGSAPDIRITGGNLAQNNGRPITVAGISQLKFVAGSDSQGRSLAAQTNQAVLEKDGQDVTAQLVVNP